MKSRENFCFLNVLEIRYSSACLRENACKFFVRLLCLSLCGFSVDDCWPTMSDTLKGVLTESGFCYGVFLSDSEFNSAFSLCILHCGIGKVNGAKKDENANDTKQITEGT
ncbi:hypothetical protein T4D_2682 [Trichinella pseudospiralis]|uniref:Uncharacterized protein n=1 Tax=Trichinella pseudospiralis TaxID=6337 RepID=A0A0V1FUB1_TRIPS|nr:hypothetical protein T4D_2682 [Trichinella pseudospiralis]